MRPRFDDRSDAHRQSRGWCCQAPPQPLPGCVAATGEMPLVVVVVGGLVGPVVEIVVEVVVETFFEGVIDTS